MKTDCFKNKNKNKKKLLIAASNKTLKKLNFTNTMRPFSSE
jgi:hypothetical protein